MRWARRAAGARKDGTALATASTPVSAEQPHGERLQQQQCADRGGTLPERGGVPGRGGGADRAVAEEADGDHREDRADEEHGRDEEGPGRIDDPPEVHGGDQGQDGEAHPDPVIVEGREGGGQGGHADGDGDGDVEDVVEDQRGGRDQAGPPPQMPPGHRVRAAAVRERGDDLSVRGHQHREERGDGERDREGEAHAVGARGGQDEHDRLGSVRHGRHRVERQCGEALESGQPVAVSGSAPGSGSGGAGVRRLLQARLLGDRGRFSCVYGHVAGPSAWAK